MLKVFKSTLTVTIIVCVICSFLVVPVFSWCGRSRTYDRYDRRDYSYPRDFWDSYTPDAEQPDPVTPDVEEPTYTPDAEQPRSVTPNPSQALLQTDGVYIEDGLGNRITFKSIQVDWNSRIKEYGSTRIASSPEESWFTESDVIRMKQAGANIVEIHIMPLAHLMQTRNVVNTEYFDTWVDTWVQWCTDNEMYCILDITGMGARWDWEVDLTFPDWMWSGLGYSTPQTKQAYDAILRDFFDLDVSAQDANREAFTNLWRFIANRYKDNPYVMFSILNEPFLGSTIHLNPSSANTALASDYSEYMTTIIDSIRAQGAQQIVVINHPWLHTPDWKWAVQPINRDNIIWEVHDYICDRPYDFDEWSSDAVTGIDAYVQLYMNNFNQPLFVGEYGFDLMSVIRTEYPNTWKTLLTNQVEYMESKQVAGMQWHQWGYLYGEHYHYSDNLWAGSLSAAESEQIIQIVLG